MTYPRRKGWEPTFEAWRLGVVLIAPNKRDILTIKGYTGKWPNYNTLVMQSYNSANLANEILLKIKKDSR